MSLAMIGLVHWITKGLSPIVRDRDYARIDADSAKLILRQCGDLTTQNRLNGAKARLCIQFRACIASARFSKIVVGWIEIGRLALSAGRDWWVGI
jgi:hypothetical protein